MQADGKPSADFREKEDNYYDGKKCENLRGGTPRHGWLRHCAGAEPSGL